MAVRLARESDAGPIAAIYAPYVDETTISFETDAPDAVAIARRMTASEDHPWFVAEAEGTIVGYAYAGPFSPRGAYQRTVETAIYLAPAATRCGVGRALYAALLAELAERGFAQAIARISLPNPASTALHAAMGFHAAGLLAAVGWKHDRVIDVALWQRGLTREDG